MRVSYAAQRSSTLEQPDAEVGAVEDVTEAGGGSNRAPGRTGTATSTSPPRVKAQTSGPASSGS